MYRVQLTGKGDRMKLLYLACLAVVAILLGYQETVPCPTALVTLNKQMLTLTGQPPPAYTLDPGILDRDEATKHSDATVASHNATGNAGPSLCVSNDVNCGRTSDSAYVSAPGDR